MMTEKDFFRELANVPELPPGLYGRIDRAIERNRLIFRWGLAIAAACICAIGMSGMLVGYNMQKKAIPPEVAEELQCIRSYVSGSDLDQASATYALYEGEETE